MRGLYVWPGDYDDIDWDDFESKGLTDVILSDSNLLSNYNTLKSHVENYTTILENTNINFHLLVSPFKNSSGSTVSPADNTQRDSVASACANIIIDCPEIQSIQFDDYFYPSSFYVYAQRAAQSLVLQDFLQTTVNSVHDADSSVKVSPTIMPTSYNACYPSTISPVADYVTVQAYRLYSQTENTLNTLQTNLNNFYGYVNGKDVLVALITFLDSYASRSWGNIRADVEMLHRNGYDDYALFNYNYAPKTDLRFLKPVKRFFNGGLISELG